VLDAYQKEHFGERPRLKPQTLPQPEAEELPLTERPPNAPAAPDSENSCEGGSRNDNASPPRPAPATQT